MAQSNLETLLEDIGLGLNDLGDMALFHKVIADSLEVFRLTEIMLAEELKTSRPTVNRWKTGATAPHKVVRESVYKTLQKRARSLIKSSGLNGTNRPNGGDDPSQAAHPG